MEHSQVGTADTDPTLLQDQSKTVTLYALGSNGNYQLGLPHNEDINRPQECIFHVTKTIVLGTSTSSATSTLETPPSPPGSASTATQARIPLHPTEAIKDIRAGGNHTLLLTNHGRVFVAGSNEYGQLALLSPSSSSSDPALSSEETASIPSPGFHLLPWTGPTPNRPITCLTATFTATMLVASHTTLYTAGHGPKGELGLGPSVTTSKIPTQAFDIRDAEGPDAKITMIRACMDHLLLLSSTGIVYGSGTSRKGQLGYLTKANGKTGVVWKIEPTTMHIDLSFKISQIATGRDFTLVAGQRTGQVKAFGKGSTGFDLGSKCTPINEKTKESIGKVQLVQDRDINVEMIDVHAGWSSVTIQHRSTGTDHLTGYFMTDAPAVSSAPGRQSKTLDRGQLPPRGLPPVLALAVGSEHSVAIVGDSQDSKVISWGWGEHGNCGSMVDERGVVGGGKWNVLFGYGEQRRGSESWKIRNGNSIDVGAGCGTTFFWVEDEEVEMEEMT